MEDEFFDEYDDFDDEEEFEQDTINWICNRYLSGHITDDNPSFANGLTGLDQIIAFNFELDPEDEEDMVEIEYIRLDIQERIRYKMNGGSYLAGVPVQIFEEAEDEPLMADVEKCIEHFGGEEEYKDWINKVAKNVLLGILTKDNPSYRNGLTGFQQFIISQIGLDLESVEDYGVFCRIRFDIENRMKDYKGGSRLVKSSSEILSTPIIWDKSGNYY